MTDRELLELAAKAAGLTHADYTGVGYDGRSGLMLTDEIGRQTVTWSPLTDDGDAFRLACQLNMDVVVRDSYACVDLFRDDINCFVESVDGHTVTDKYAATRRVIVRAAAEIGKDMK